MKILVTGITGHTGRWFLKALEDNLVKDEIHVITRSTSNISFLNESPLNVTIHAGDLTDKEFLKDVTKDIQTIVHIANIRNSLDILEVAKENGVDWFIGVHTTGMYSNFKTASEEYIQIEEKVNHFRNDLDITILKPTMIYGSSMDRNMFKLIKFVDKSPVFPMFGNGKNLMQPVTAKDLGNAYYAVLKNSDKTKNNNYNLPGKYPITYKQLVKTVADELNTDIKFVHIPIGLSYRIASLAENIPGFPISGEQVLRMQEDKNFTYLAAQKDFDYKPVSFAEGIQDEVEEYLTIKGE